MKAVFKKIIVLACVFGMPMGHAFAMKRGDTKCSRTFDKKKICNCKECDKLMYAVGNEGAGDRFFMAINNGNLEKVQYYGKELCGQYNLLSDSYGSYFGSRKRPLHLAVEKACSESNEEKQKIRKEIVKHLIDNGAYVDPLDGRRATPLVMAARRGDLGVANMLIGAGTNINISGEGKVNPLWAALVSLDGNMVELLLDNEAKHDIIIDRVKVGGGWKVLNEPAFFAPLRNGFISCWAYPPLLKIFMDKKLDLSAKDKSGKTILDRIKDMRIHAEQHIGAFVQGNSKFFISSEIFPKMITILFGSFDEYNIKVVVVNKKKMEEKKITFHTRIVKGKGGADNYFKQIDDNIKVEKFHPVEIDLGEVIKMYNILDKLESNLEKYLKA